MYNLAFGQFSLKGDEYSLRLLLGISGRDLLHILNRQTRGAFFKSLDAVPGIELLASLSNLKSSQGFRLFWPLILHSYKSKR